MCKSHNITRDHNGNVCQLVRQDTSAVVAIYRYDAYGLHQTEARADSDTLDAAQVSQPWRYQSKWHHSQSGLVDFGYRFYSPGLGNWMSRDPLGEAGGLNLYGYVRNDPVNLHDPYGLDWVDNASNFAAGMGDNLSFGATGRIRQWMGVDDVVDRCSGWYAGGELAGTGVGLAMGGAHAGRNAFAQAGRQGGFLTRAARGGGRLFFDNRGWGSVRSTWSRSMGGLRNRGQALHHAFIPQRWRFVPQGIRNSGLNYMPISAGFNSWMNGSTRARVAVELGFRGAAGMTELSPLGQLTGGDDCGCS